MEKIKAYFPNDYDRAIKIFTCESGLRENAVGDGHLAYKKNGVVYGKSYGVAQIRHLPGRPAPSQLLELDFNLQYAKGMYEAQGWKPWTCNRRV